jgi:hypothetical protein
MVEKNQGRLRPCRNRETRGAAHAASSRGRGPEMSLLRGVAEGLYGGLLTAWMDHRSLELHLSPLPRGHWRRPLTGRDELDAE